MENRCCPALPSVSPAPHDTQENRHHTGLCSSLRSTPPSAMYGKLPPLYSLLHVCLQCALRRFQIDLLRTQRRLLCERRSHGASVGGTARRPQAIRQKLCSGVNPVPHLIRLAISFLADAHSPHTHKKCCKGHCDPYSNFFVTLVLRRELCLAAHIRL